MNTNQHAAIAQYVFFSRGEKRSSDIICRVDNSPFSHMGIGFKIEAEGGNLKDEGKREKGKENCHGHTRTEDDKTEVYYEALVGKGFRGPKPLTDLIGWQAELPERRSVLVAEIPSLAGIAELKRRLTQSYTEIVTYSEWQLVALFFAIRYGWEIAESHKGVVCSEIAARILYPEIELRDHEHHIFDLVTPGTAWRNLNRLDQWSRALNSAPFFTIRYAAGSLPLLPSTIVRLNPEPCHLIPVLEALHA